MCDFPMFSFTASSSERCMPTRHKWEIHNQKDDAQQSPVRNNTFDLKKDSISLRGRAKGFKGGNKDSPEEEPESPLRSRRDKSTSTANQSDSMEYQKKCSGCKKTFPDPSVLKSHSLYCNKVKLVKTEVESATPSQCQPDEGNRTAPSEKQDDAPLNKKGRIQTIHKGQVDSTEKTSTVPLDITEDDQPCSPPPKKQLQQPLKTMSESSPPSSPPSPKSPDENKKKRNRHRSLLSKWHTMGTSCDEGYVCLVCQKISRSKYLLMEHFRIHTGEKPLKCELCTEKFRYRSQLSTHRRRCCTMIQCDKCEKKFYTKVKFNKHVQKQHKNWAHFCKVCGKGFLIEGRLQNHMKHHDQKDL